MATNDRVDLDQGIQVDGQKVGVSKDDVVDHTLYAWFHEERVVASEPRPRNCDVMPFRPGITHSLIVI